MTRRLAPTVFMFVALGCSRGRAPDAHVPSDSIPEGALSMLETAGTGCQWERVTPQGIILVVARLPDPCRSYAVRFSSSRVAFVGFKPADTMDGPQYVLDPDGSLFRVRSFPYARDPGWLGFTSGGDLAVCYGSVDGVWASFLRLGNGGAPIERSFVFDRGNWKRVADCAGVSFQDDLHDRSPDDPRTWQGHYAVAGRTLYRDDVVIGSNVADDAKFWPPSSPPAR